MRYRFLFSALGATALGTAAYARFVEPRWIERTHTRVPIRGLPPALDGLRIALLTDFHAGEHMPLARVRRVPPRDGGAAPPRRAHRRFRVTAHGGAAI